MTDTARNCIETLEALLPRMSPETRAHLLGYGEGLEEGYKRRDEEDAKNPAGQAESGNKKKAVRRRLPKGR